MVAKQMNMKITQPLASIYLLYGTETYLMHNLRKAIIEKAMSAEERAFNLSVYDMEEQSVDAAIEDADTLPFLGEKKVVILEKPLFLTGDTKKMKVDHHLDRLTAYLESPSPSTILVIIAPYEKLDKRKKLVKVLEKHADVRELSHMTDRALFQLLAEKAKENGANYTTEAHERLLALIGTETTQLMNEVQKLSLYVGTGQAITPEAVDLVASKTIESDVFALVDRVMKKEIGKAYQLLNDLLKQKEDPIKLTGLIMRQIRLAFQAESYQALGYTQKQIAGSLRVHPYAVKIASEQGKRYGAEKLKKALLYCAATDDAIKTGKMDKTIALQLLINQIAAI
ncbi:DNA polymerase III subunit delta [Camelliibacillus cellulosilyticus]|uniref:DNA polymerase III subunit delta n=1 Tax=Camelliibacillus cellulosilyticus TaxID=2174486 RepID=A0ABV9GIC7_9BACL